ncbi:MAG: Ig-like domain-containing protein, partial [Butyrivibrio sp.]|nr:Ig-like domain-containing protein [Butyrivibrio sp.]
MKNIFLKVCAALLAGCIVLSSITAVQIGKVYAEENQDVEEIYEENDEENVTPEVILQSEPEPAPEPPAYEPDPFDYNLICYTPSISFGTVYAGDTVPAKQFSIVNVGQTSFPLTWEEVDPNTAFDIGYISPDLNMDPNETVTFSISTYEGIKPGSYVASYIFFSANDIRRHHTARVDVTVTVKDVTPFITSVDVMPGSVTIPAGKSYQFDASVSGGNGYDPSVTWSIYGNQSADTTIDGNGKLT